MINQKQIELTDVLLKLTSQYEDQGFMVTGNGFPETEAQYDLMVRFDNNDHKPSWQEVVDQYETLVDENDKQKYSLLRSKEYPSIEEQLDTIFHSGVDVWKEQIQAIKDKYPKP